MSDSSSQEAGAKVKKIQIDADELNRLTTLAAKQVKYAAINKLSYERRNARIAIKCEKADAAEITVSEAEIDAYLAKKAKAKK